MRTLVDLAKNFRLETVAEWVGSEEDAKLLLELGVDYFQGFYFGEPTVSPDWLTIRPRKTSSESPANSARSEFTDHRTLPSLFPLREIGDLLAHRGKLLFELADFLVALR